LTITSTSYTNVRTLLKLVISKMPVKYSIVKDRFLKKEFRSQESEAGMRRRIPS
jgi:hypothetical protein